jgi:phage tail protein X
MQFNEVDATRYSYQTGDFDTIDIIAFNFYGRHAGTTEAILEINEGLESYGPLLPAGLTVYLPSTVAEEETTNEISLWD